MVQDSQGNLHDPRGRFAPRRLEDPGQLDLSTPWDRLLDSAVRLQELVPDTVLVGGSAAALHARHRASYDHDRVLADLGRRFDAVLDALEREPDWETNRATPGKIILGNLGGIEAGVRQLIRTRPLETEQIDLPNGSLVIPTMAETLRIKAFLIIKRNQVRDYLDEAAVSAELGVDKAAEVLNDLDDFYDDPQHQDGRVCAQVQRQLSDPEPRDTRSLDDFVHYKGLVARWADWDAVCEQCRSVAAAMLVA